MKKIKYFNHHWLKLLVIFTSACIYPFFYLVGLKIIMGIFKTWIRESRVTEIFSGIFLCDGQSPSCIMMLLLATLMKEWFPRILVLTHYYDSPRNIKNMSRPGLTWVYANVSIKCGGCWGKTGFGFMEWGINRGNTYRHPIWKIVRNIWILFTPSSNI